MLSVTDYQKYSYEYNNIYSLKADTAKTSDPLPGYIGKSLSNSMIFSIDYVNGLGFPVSLMNKELRWTYYNTLQSDVYTYIIKMTPYITCSRICSGTMLSMNMTDMDYVALNVYDKYNVINICNQYYKGWIPNLRCTHPVNPFGTAWFSTPMYRSISYMQDYMRENASKFEDVIKYEDRWFMMASYNLEDLGVVTTLNITRETFKDSNGIDTYRHTFIVPEPEKYPWFTGLCHRLDFNEEHSRISISTKRAFPGMIVISNPDVFWSENTVKRLYIYPLPEVSAPVKIHSCYLNSFFLTTSKEATTGTFATGWIPLPEDGNYNLQFKGFVQLYREEDRNVIWVKLDNSVYSVSNGLPDIPTMIRHHECARTNSLVLEVCNIDPTKVAVLDTSKPRYGQIYTGTDMCEMADVFESGISGITAPKTMNQLPSAAASAYVTITNPEI